MAHKEEHYGDCRGGLYEEACCLCNASSACARRDRCLAICWCWRRFRLGSPVNRFCRRLSRSMWSRLWDLAFLWTYYPRLASVLIFIPLAAGFSASGFEHFQSDGPDNVFRMAATEWTLPFTISAVLLAVLELCGCWLCIRMFGKSRSGQFQN